MLVWDVFGVKGDVWVVKVVGDKVGNVGWN